MANRKGRRKHCRSNDKCHFVFEAFTVKMTSKCSKTDSTSQTISAAVKLEPRGDLLLGPLNTGLARSTSVLLASLPGKLSEEVAREPPACEQYLFTLTSLVISGKKERKIKREDGVGAVTSTVRFLLNPVTLGQVKAGTSNFITLVLTCLSTGCSVCGRPWFTSQQCWQGHLDELGRIQQARTSTHLSAVVSNLFFSFRTPEYQTKCPDQLHPLYIHALEPALIFRPSLPNWFSFPNGSGNFFLCKVSAVYSLE